MQMFEWDDQTPEHFLLGTVIVRALDRESGKPLSGVSVAIADDLDTACKKG